MSISVCTDIRLSEQRVRSFLFQCKVVFEPTSPLALAKRRFFAVLHQGVVDSPEKAVKAVIVNEVRKISQ
jgi:hypothetical protein